jgi:peptidoglycan hydrolase-like protein with peptidoglycan-binding domain
MTLRLIKKGLSGTDCKSWQRLLADRGYSPGAIDGDFGPNSEAALKKFQSAKGLTADGVLGAQSGERLLEG